MILLSHLNKTFRTKNNNVEALKDVSLKINDGEIYGIIGYSGAGKSTLVRCLNLLEFPDSGSITVNESGPFDINNGKLTREGKKVSEKELCSFRRGIGMIFQLFNLLDRSTVFDNVAYPLKFSKMSKEQISSRVKELLALVDLTDKINAYPCELSGGQKQRVAIARALANNPKVLLSDEATSALDPDATESILNLLKKLNRELGLTVVLITHEMAVIKSVCDRVAVMEDGRVVEEGRVYDIFESPKESITKRFISSASTLSKADKMIEEDSPLVALKPGDKLIRLTFTQKSVGDSLISDVSRRFNVNINLVLANVDIIAGAALGGVIAIISGEKADEAIKFFEDSFVRAEVLKIG